MNIPALLLGFLRNYLFSEALRALLTSDWAINLYFFAGLVLVGVAWRKHAWFRLLGNLYVEYYQWAEKTAGGMPGNYKLRKYMQQLNQRIIELKGRPMTDEEIRQAKLAADALAEKDHLKNSDE
jgi:hypothetical protein